MQQCVNFNFAVVGKHKVVAIGSGVVEVDVQSKMVMEVLASTQVSVKEHDRGMITFFSTLKAVLIFPKHDVKSMAQCVAP